MMSKPCPPRPELDELLRRAAQHKMTPEKVFEQRVSFVYGQMMNCAPHVTKEQIRQIAIEIYGRPEKQHTGGPDPQLCGNWSA